MGGGAVVVGSDTPPVREMIRHDRSGLLVDFFDEEAIADQVVAILRDPPSYRHLGDRAASLIERDYSIQAVLPRMLDLYRRTVATGHVPPASPIAR